MIFYFIFPIIRALTSHISLSTGEYIVFFKSASSTGQNCQQVFFAWSWVHHQTLHWGQRHWFQYIKIELWNKQVIQILSWILHNGKMMISYICLRESICNHCYPLNRSGVWLWKWQPCHHYLIIPPVFLTVIRRDRWKAAADVGCRKATLISLGLPSKPVLLPFPRQDHRPNWLCWLSQLTGRWVKSSSSLRTRDALHTLLVNLRPSCQFREPVEHNYIGTCPAPAGLIICCPLSPPLLGKQKG